MVESPTAALHPTTLTRMGRPYASRGGCGAGIHMVTRERQRAQVWEFSLNKHGLSQFGCVGVNLTVLVLV